MKLGQINIRDFLTKTGGDVRGSLVSDAKDRYYAADYDWSQDPQSSDHIFVWRRGNHNVNKVRFKNPIDLDEALVSFFGLYSGDGAKGGEDLKNLGKIKPPISFSQKEPNLIAFAVEQFRKIFSGSIHFVFFLGEDSAFFMAGEGAELLKVYYKGNVPAVPPLSEIRTTLDVADKRYLMEKRPSQSSPESDLAFYYLHKEAMQEILKEKKAEQLLKAGIKPQGLDRVEASLRRPFKKGARLPGGSSRSDETNVGSISGFGELFLKMMHEIESSIYENTQVSSQGLIQWVGKPSEIGAVIDIKNFFETSPYGRIANERPNIRDHGPESLMGQWKRSNEIILKPKVRMTPLWCYTAGLYLAEGGTDKAELFSMYKKRPKGFALNFTSSENMSLELLLRALTSIFREEDCLHSWKIKVGSQYFPELTVIGLKNAVPMLRGGASGDGKLRTMEISLAVKDWALQVAPVLEQYKQKYTHVEPTGAGVPRIDFSASSTLCRWYFPLVVYATFGQIFSDPNDFV